MLLDVNDRRIKVYPQQVNNTSRLEIRKLIFRRGNENQDRRFWFS
jgi:hypothetical protein